MANAGITFNKGRDIFFYSKQILAFDDPRLQFTKLKKNACKSAEYKKRGGKSRMCCHTIATWASVSFSLIGEKPNYHRCMRASSSSVELRHLKRIESPNWTDTQRKKELSDSDRAAVLMSALSVVSYPVLPTRPLCVLGHRGSHVTRATSGWAAAPLPFFLYSTTGKRDLPHFLHESLIELHYVGHFICVFEPQIMFFNTSRWLSPICQFTYCSKFIFFPFLFQILHELRQLWG